MLDKLEKLVGTLAIAVGIGVLVVYLPSVHSYGKYVSGGIAAAMFVCIHYLKHNKALSRTSSRHVESDDDQIGSRWGQAA